MYRHTCEFFMNKLDLILQWLKSESIITHNEHIGYKLYLDTLNSMLKTITHIYIMTNYHRHQLAAYSGQAATLKNTLLQYFLCDYANVYEHMLIVHMDNQLKITGEHGPLSESAHKHSVAHVQAYCQ